MEKVMGRYALGGVFFMLLSGQALLRARVPRTLSDWNVFKISEAGLALHDQVRSYELAVPLFSDYAGKFRTIKIPRGVGKIGFSMDKAFSFPVGSVVTKTFYYPVEKIHSIAIVGRDGKEHPYVPEAKPSGIFAHQHLIETRILYRRKDGWQTYSYIWDRDQRAARLNVLGKKYRIRLQVDAPEDFVYQVPNRNQCIGCHMRMDGFERKIRPIGLRAKHLNRNIEMTTGVTNQLRDWYEQGVLAELPNLKLIPRLFALDDDQASLESRARSYLDINCAHCHSADGPANTSGLFLAYEAREPTRYGICKTPVAAGNGGGQVRYDIEPGHPDQSLLWQRLRSRDPAVRMPEFGRSLAHQPAVDLIYQWIQQLDGHCE